MTDQPLPANFELAENVILWRCPVCGGTDPDSSQRARACARTRACSKVKRSGIIEHTLMERWEYTPVRKVEEPR